MLAVDIQHRLGAFALEIRFESGPGLTALFGRSGAGKTSVVNAVAGLIRPLRGYIAVDGAVLLDTERGVFVPAHRRRIGYIFQEGRLFPHLSVRQNSAVRTLVRAALPHASGPVRRHRRAARRRAAARPPAGPVVRRRKAARRDRPRSVGEPARAADGRALGLARRRPQGRDPPYLERLRDHADVPIVYVSHAAAEVARLATTIVLIADGRVQAVGPVAEIMGAPGNTRSRAALRRVRCSRSRSRRMICAGG